MAKKKTKVAILKPPLEEEERKPLLGQIYMIETKTYWRKLGFTDAQIKKGLVKLGRRYALMIDP